MDWLLRKLGYYRCDWGFATGRHYLLVNGYVVAVAGDSCRDENLGYITENGYSIWTGEDIKKVLGVENSKE